MKYVEMEATDVYSEFLIMHKEFYSNEADGVDHYIKKGKRSILITFNDGRTMKFTFYKKDHWTLVVKTPAEK